MKQILAVWCVCLFACLGISAQTADEYNRNEFFIGYSNEQFNRGDYEGFNGVEGSYVRNVSRYLGVKGDVSAAFRNDSFSGSFQYILNGPTINYRSESKSSLSNFLGGVQIKDNASKARLKPFGHALAGVAYSRDRFRNTSSNQAPFEISSNQAGFSAAVGGGLDIKINDRFDFRAIQADYNPMRFNGYWSNSFRFGIGLVIK